MLDPESPDVQLAVFGREVEFFLESDIGVYIKQCAEQDLQSAKDRLVTADPDDAKAIRALQFKAAVASAVMGWLEDAIRSGRQAQEMIQETQ